jgi:eukaryotic-like serine/threonine-protein kinase
LQFLLTDFGIARLREQTDAITVTGASMLTYDYASPEQFNQSKTVATPTDYYSLGVVIYECLTGAVPFEYEQDDLLMHINRVISCPLPVPLIPARPGYKGGPGKHALPPSLLQLLEGLLRKQPSLRLSDPVSIRHLLKMAAMEDLQGIKMIPSDEAKLTMKNPLMETSLAKKKQRAPFTLALLLIAIAILFSWTNLARHNNKIASPAIPVPGTLPLIETKHILPPETAHVVRARLTPAVTTGNFASPVVDPGVALVNGIYYDDFDQQDSLWDTGKDENSEFILLDGKYTMRGFRDSLSYSSSIKLKMDTEKDFTIAATAIHQGESAGDPFGIIFCGDELRDAFFVFYITSNGYYSIGTSVGDEWNILTDWTASSNLRQNGEMNIFSIERRGGVLRFLINDKLEKILPFTGGYGSYFGLRVDGAQTISFDQFIVKGSSTINNPL